MFYQIGESEGRAEVYGIRTGGRDLVDPHRVFATRWLGYDDIRRNVLISALPEGYSWSFCNFLRRKFPRYRTFEVVEVYYPSVTRFPGANLERTAYSCGTPY